ncbi:MAG: D-glycero-beta-D-manno-heptose 1,7-bisphosphate 7-phosphatase [Zetaproteobacteria bacterium]|nr:MAG: D-glycero-beta-D-manno-heptose 1,7-bisphosphate 7-phosphatase [Zetaproteobacteria bacterium]
MFASMTRIEAKAVLLDRDGVINFDSPDYILAPNQWRPIPGSLEAIAKLTSADIPVAIVSNQSALGRGMLDQETFQAIHAKMMLAIEEAGGEIAHTAYCPHAPEDECNCRKPRPGLIDETLVQLKIANQVENVVLIGDSVRDVQAAMAAGVTPMLVQTGYGDATAILEKSRRLMPDIRHFSDLSAAVDSLLENTSC